MPALRTAGTDRNLGPERTGSEPRVRLGARCPRGETKARAAAANRNLPGSARSWRGRGAPKAPEEREGTAAAVAARSVSAPPTAANSNAGLFTSPRPPRLKETRCPKFLPGDRKESCRAGSTVSASSAT